MPCIRVCKSLVPPQVPKCPDCSKCAAEYPPKYPPYVFPEILRKIWEAWDLRIIILYILFTQLYLLVYGRRRRKLSRTLINLNLWLLYLFSDLLATISLGKLSNVRAPMSLLRSLWAPIVLFYLGGPDTITVLHLEENQMWLRHFIGLLMQGFRTSYVLYVTWTKSWISLLALLMLLSGLIKYGERVWVIRSRVQQNSKGFLRLDESTINHLDKVNNNITKPNVDLVLRAYSCFQTMKPHAPNYICTEDELDKLVQKFRGWVENGIVNAFELVEIELGFMYDVLFSKVDTIFTLWGCILRFISFSCIVSVLVGFFLIEKPGHVKADLPITILLLLGALFLEIGGIVVQLYSDWAIVWAYKQYPNKVVTPVFYLHKLVIFKRKRWSELMGQFSLLNFSMKYKPTKFNEMPDDQPSMKVLKVLIINQLRKISPNVLEGETLQPLTMKRGEWTLGRYGYLDMFKWSIELEFNESISIWHVATDICYHLEDPHLVTNEVKATKILSYYMMHLLFTCPNRFPICDANGKLMQAWDDVKKIFEGGKISSNIEACKKLLQTQCDSSNTIVDNIQKLVRDLREREDKWDIMSNMWVEMLCFAASHCPLKHHVQELRRGGEFLTHVWLLLVHFGVTKNLEKSRLQKIGYTKDILEESAGECFDFSNVC